MMLNSKKTKEMLICFSMKMSVNDIPNVVICNNVIERVNSIKVLGVYVNNKLNWSDHIDYIYKKASQRVFNIIMLKRSGIKTKDLCQIYCSIIRSIMEYAAPVWHFGITKEQCNLLESVQKRVLKIILPSYDYYAALSTCGLTTLKNRRDKLCNVFFRKVESNSGDKLHPLIKQLKIKDYSYNLRNPMKYQNLVCRTDRFKNTFIPSIIAKCDFK